jgi:hypothetical protein
VENARKKRAHSKCRSINFFTTAKNLLSGHEMGQPQANSARQAGKAVIWQGCVESLLECGRMTATCCSTWLNE